MLKDVEYWVAEDEKNIAITQNNQIHKKQLESLSDKAKILNWLRTDKTHWRRRTLDKFEIFLGKEIHGNVIEIGAGTAWCSALLSKKTNVREVIAIDFDLFSIEEIMPKVFKALDAAENKIQRVLGGYDDMNCEDNSVDYIFAMGALHHSQNLLTTFNELWRVLKPGGSILISEPTYSNDLTLKNEYIWREGTKEDGSKNKDNGDQRFRVCQWEAYALEAGFEIYPFTFDDIGFLGKIKSLLIGDKVIGRRKNYRGFNKIMLSPFFGKTNWVRAIRKIIRFDFSVPDHDKLMLIMEKPIDHTYKAMSENIYKDGA